MPVCQEPFVRAAPAKFRAQAGCHGAEVRNVGRRLARERPHRDRQHENGEHWNGYAVERGVPTCQECASEYREIKEAVRTFEFCRNLNGVRFVAQGWIAAAIVFEPSIIAPPINANNAPSRPF